MTSFGKGGERFKESKFGTPGPGAYDPSDDLGYKVDPKSGFAPGDRFHDYEQEGELRDWSPPRQKQYGKADTRSYTWAANRIAELEKELQMAKNRIKELERGMYNKKALEEALKQAENDIALLKRQKEAAQRENRDRLSSLGAKARDLNDAKKQLETAALEAKRSQEELTRLQQQLSETKTQLQKQSDLSKKYQADIIASQKVQETMTKEHKAKTIAAQQTIQGHLERIDDLKGELSASNVSIAKKDSQLSRLSADLSEVQLKLESQSEEKSKLQEELSAVRKDNKETKLSLAEAREQCATLEEDRNVKTQMIAQHEERIKTLQADLESSHHAQKAMADNHNAKASAAQEIIQGHLKHVEDLERELSAANVSIAERDNKLSRLSADILETQEKLASQSDQTRKLEEELTAVCKDREETKLALAESKQQCVTLEDDNSSKSQQITQHEEQITKLRIALAKSEDEGKSKDRRIQELEEIAARMSVLEEELKAAKEGRSQSEGRVTELEALAGVLTTEKENMSAQIEQLDKQVEQLEDSVADMSARNAELSDRIKALEQENSQLNENIKQLEESCAQANERATKAEEERNVQAGNDAAQIARVQEELAKMSGLSSDLQQKLEESHKDFQAKNDELLDLESKLRISEEDIAAKMIALQDAEEKLRLVTEESRRRELRLEDLHNNLVASQNESEAHKSKVATLKQENDDFREKLHDFEGQLKEKCDAISDVQALLATAQEEIKQKIEDLSKQEKRHLMASAIAEEESRRKAQQLAELQKKLELSQRTANDHKAALTKLEQERQLLIKDRDNIAEVSRQTCDQLDKLQMQMAKLEEKARAQEMKLSHLQEVQQTADDREKEIVKFKEVLASAREEMDSLKAKIAALNASQTIVRMVINVQQRDEAEARAIEENGEYKQYIDALEKELEETKCKFESAEKQVAELNWQAEKYQDQLRNARTITLEMRRLADDNTVLANRTQQLELDLRRLLNSDSCVLGHNNPKQKIQYHLRLKQELEEMRRELVVQLRDKFLSEQCIRYLAASSQAAPLPAPLTARDITGQHLRGAASAILPESLADSVVFATPIARNMMKWAGKGKEANSDMLPYRPKAEMEKAINDTHRKTLEEAEDVIKSAKKPPEVPRLEIPVSLGDASFPGDNSVPQSARDSIGISSIESRILSKIAAVCEPVCQSARGARRTSSN